MGVGALELWPWNAACETRGSLSAPNCRAYVHELLHLKVGDLSPAFRCLVRNHLAANSIES